MNRKQWMLFLTLLLVVATGVSFFLTKSERQPIYSHNVRWAIAAPVALQTWDNDLLVKIRVNRLDIEVIRWYKSSSKWCMVQTVDGVLYAVDEPGQQCWDRFTKALREKDEYPLEFKIRERGFDD